MLIDLPRQTIEAARLGRSWPVLSVKQALNAQMPPEAVLAEMIGLLGLPPATRLRRKRLAGLLDAARANAGAFELLAPAGMPVTIAPPRIVGEGNSRPLAGRTRSLYRGAIEGVSVRGRSQLAERENDVLLDFEDWEFASLDDQPELDSAVLCMEGDRAVVIDLPVTSETLHLEEAFSLLGPNSFAWGHWLAEYLPRMALVLGHVRRHAIPVLIDRGMPRQHREALELMLDAGHPVIEVHGWQKVTVGRLWTASSYYYAPIHAKMTGRYSDDLVIPPPDRFAGIAASMMERFLAGIEAGRQPADERIYLARKPQRHRRLVNAKAVEAVAMEKGFRKVYPEDLGFADQLRLIRGARFVTGPEGSAFFTVFFARPGTRILILNHTHTVMLAGVTGLHAAMGVDASVLTGPFESYDPDYPHFGDYVIDPQAFAAFLDQWLAEDGVASGLPAGGGPQPSAKPSP